jgi:hypothetical protein
MSASKSDSEARRDNSPETREAESVRSPFIFQFPAMSLRRAIGF